VTIDDPTKHGQPPPATGATSQSGLAAMLADSESGSRGSAGARTEGGVRLVPPADVRIAAARLEAFEAQPECHTHTTD